MDSLKLVWAGISLETWCNHPDHPKFNLWKAIESNKGAYTISHDAKQYPQSFDESKMMFFKPNVDVVDGAVRERRNRSYRHSPSTPARGVVYRRTGQASEREPAPNTLRLCAARTGPAI